MTTTTYGYRYIDDGDAAKGTDGWFASIQFNINRLDSHNHDGVNSVALTGDYEPLSFANDEELDSDDLPSGGTPYGWNLNGVSDFDDGDFVGGVALSENGTGISAAADVLGNSRYCAFGGTDTYLSSTDSGLAGTGDFSFAFWCYRADWSSAVDETILSRRLTSGSVSGWALFLASDGYLFWKTYNAGTVTSQIKLGYQLLRDGYHHIGLVRDADAYTIFYIDGLVVARVNNTSQVITAAGSFDVGCQEAAGTAAQFFEGRIDELVFHDDKIYDTDMMARLYCRSARRFVKEVYNEGGTQELEFESPMEGQPIPYTPMFKDNGQPTFDDNIGVGAGGFDDLDVRYRVWKNKVFIDGDCLCADTAPVAVDTQLYMSLPLPIDQTSNGFGMFVLENHWYDAINGIFPLTTALGQSFARFWTHSAAGAMTVLSSLVDDNPATWAPNDGLIISFEYPVSRTTT